MLEIRQMCPNCTLACPYFKRDPNINIRDSPLSNIRRRYRRWRKTELKIVCRMPRKSDLLKMWFLEIELLTKNRNFVKNRNCGQKSEFFPDWTKNWNWSKIEIPVENLNFGKQKFLSKIEILPRLAQKSKLCPQIEIPLKNRNSSQKYEFCKKNLVKNRNVGQIGQKIEIVSKNRNCFQKSKYRIFSHFFFKIEVLTRLRKDQIAKSPILKMAYYFKLWWKKPHGSAVELDLQYRQTLHRTDPSNELPSFSRRSNSFGGSSSTMPRI